MSICGYLHFSIEAPLQICFDLARDAEFHVESARETGERIVAGRAAGLWELNDEITFEGRHLGLRQRFSTRITQFDSPNGFVDEMTRGAFSSMRHEHRFETLNGATVMTDILEWRSPFGVLGRVADRFIESHLRRFLTLRAARLKEHAESLHTSTT